jgi:hypothetical protein
MDRPVPDYNEIYMQSSMQGIVGIGAKIGRLFCISVGRNVSENLDHEDK